MSQTDSSKQQTNRKPEGHGGEGELYRPWACSHDAHTVGLTEDPATTLPRHAHFLKRKKGGNPKIVHGPGETTRARASVRSSKKGKVMEGFLEAGALGLAVWIEPEFQKPVDGEPEMLDV